MTVTIVQEQETAKKLYQDNKVIEVDMIMRTWDIHNGSKLQAKDGRTMTINNIAEGLGTCTITLADGTQAPYTLGNICKAIVIGNIEVIG